MRKLLVLVDLQNDFIDGTLGSNEAVAIVPKVVKKIHEWDGDLVVTLDTHDDNYLHTQEGMNLPVIHCVRNTSGWELEPTILHEILSAHKFSDTHQNIFSKETFGSVELAQFVKDDEYDHVELVGLCTDICVISNAMLIKAFAPETKVLVDASCCAGVTSQSHKNALEAMKMCQIEIINEGF